MSHGYSFSSLKQLWQATSMAAFLGSLLTALIFHGDLPGEYAFIWTMAVFAGSLLLVLPGLVLLAVPFQEGIRALSRRYDRWLFPAVVIGGVVGVMMVLILLLLIKLGIPGLTFPGGRASLFSYGGKILLTAYAYGAGLALFIGLNSLPAERRQAVHPPR